MAFVVLIVTRIESKVKKGENSISVVYSAYIKVYKRRLKTKKIIRIFE